MTERSAIFIDEAYLYRLVRDEFPGARIDYRLLPSKLSRETNLLRTYVYSSLPYLGNSPLAEQRAFHSRRRQFFSVLRLLPRYTVQLGRTELRGYREDGSPIFEQKRVDILLAVDLVKISADGHIQQAILVAGDSDFIPAIAAAKSEGVIVSLYHGGTAHNDLLEEVDEHFRIDQELIESVRLRDQ